MHNLISVTRTTMKSSQMRIGQGSSSFFSKFDGLVDINIFSSTVVES